MLFCKIWSFGASNRNGRRSARLGEPKVFLRALSHGPSVDLWAAGCIFAELCNPPGGPLLPAKERAKMEGGPDGLQTAQLQLLVRLLGPPRPATWPQLASLRHWQVVQHWPEVAEAEHAEEARVARSLSERLATQRPADAPPPSAAAVALLARLLEYNPERRISAAEALRAAYFGESEG